MAHEVRAPRRGFLGTMLAALGASWLPWRTADHQARWEAPVAQPGGLARLSVSARASRGAQRARVALVISTPLEVVRKEAGVVTLMDGVGGGEFALEYPYDELVAGDYEYRVEVVIDGRVLRPPQSVGYHIGAPSCFA